MALHNNPIPNGRWTTSRNSLHWLAYKYYHSYSDMDGNDWMSLRKQILFDTNEVVELLEEHNIEISDCFTQEFVDHKNLGTRVGLAIGFADKEDKILAKLILKCDELD